MRVVRSEDVTPWSSEGQHRSGGLEFRDLLCGDELAPDNFWMTLVKADGNFFSPRHRHNFDQIRFCLEGRMSVGPNFYLEVGQIGFFPEGQHYGPQQDTEPNWSMVLQFGGISGSGFVSRRQMLQAREELVREGRFEKGVFRRTSGEGRKNQDGFEAIYERVFQRPVIYPKPRYDRTVVVSTDAFGWLPYGEEGVARKLLGVFTEREIRLEMFKLEQDTAAELSTNDGQSLLFVSDGNGTVNGETVARHSAIYAQSGEILGVTAEKPIEVLLITLPPLQ